MAIDIIQYRRSRDKNTEDIQPIKIESHLPSPTDNDYKVGYIKRHFCQKINDKNSTIFEVSEDFKSTILSNGLYIVETIKWRLIGTPQEIKDSNKKSISLVYEKIPNLSLYLVNHLQFAKIN